MRDAIEKFIFKITDKMEKGLFNSQEEPIISFRDANQVVGQFRIVNGTLTFEGNTDKSADIFINFLTETFKSYTEEEVLILLEKRDDELDYWYVHKCTNYPNLTEWFNENCKK